MKKTRALKPSIRQNVFGNWNGYLGGRKVEMFFGSTTEQEIAAHEWLEVQQEMKNQIEGGK